MAAGVTNWYHGPIERLKDLVAASDTFQTLTGSDNAAAAEAHVHIGGITTAADIEPARPCAIVDAGPDFRITRDTSSSAYAGGSLCLMLEATVPEGSTDTPDAATWFYELVGDIIEEIFTLSLPTNSTYLLVRGLGLYDGPPVRSEPGDADGDYYQVIFVIEWGPRE